MTNKDLKKRIGKATLKDIKSFKSQMEVRIKFLAAERDMLRNLESEVSELADTCGSACELLEEAVEKLSELV
jgi:hypothetical protein